MHRMFGLGIPNVYLASGYAVEGEGDEQAFAYTDLDGLYVALAVEVARRSSVLTAGEFRFLRKRLGWSQGQIAARFCKDAQTVAKWEKGTLPVPIADGEAVRLFVLSEIAPAEVASRVSAWARGQVQGTCCDYILDHTERGWKVRPAMDATSDEVQGAGGLDGLVIRQSAASDDNSAASVWILSGGFNGGASGTLIVHQASESPRLKPQGRRSRSVVR